MKKFSLFIIGLICVLFASCNLGNKISDEGTVTINIGGGSRNIAPVNWNLDDVNNWTVIFDNIEDGVEDISETIEKNVSATFSLPVGTYNISVEGVSVDNSYVLTGSTKNAVTITSEETLSVFVYVSLKKTEEGSGNFEYTIIFKNELFADMAEAATFNASLTSVKTENVINLPLEKVLEDGEYPKIKINMEDIPSGYYYLTVDYWDGIVKGYVNLNDPIVEIADGKTTSGECEYLFAAENTEKVFYADNREDHINNNGLVPQARKEFNSTIKWLSDHVEEWTMAHIYFYDNTVYNPNELMYEINQTPLYNTDINPTSNVPGTPGYNKEIAVYIGLDQSYVYSIMQGKIVMDYSGIGGVYLRSEKESAPVVEVMSNGLSFSEYDYLKFHLDNVNLKITNIGSGLYDPLVEPYISIVSTNAASYVNESSVPLVSLEFENDTEVSDVSTKNISYDFLLPAEDGMYEYKGVKYNYDKSTYALSFYTDEESNTINCYTRLRGTPYLYYAYEEHNSFGYYWTDEPSTDIEQLTMLKVALAENNTFYGVDRSSKKIVYFNGETFDEDSYANYALPTDLNEVNSMYYDKFTGYLYFSICAGGDFHMTYIDTKIKPVSQTYVPTEEPMTFGYSSLFVKDGMMFGTTFKYESSSPISENNILIRPFTIDGEMITFEEAYEPIDLRKTVVDDVLDFPERHQVTATDFYFYNEDIYFLCKYELTAFGNSLNNPQVNALGYIGKLNSDGILDASTKLGWLESPSEYTNNYTMYGTDYSVTGYNPNPDSAEFEGFWGPQRIVAVKKADEIVIEDYGIYLSNKEGEAQRCRLKGGFATVNLADKTINYSSSDMKLGYLGSTDGWSMAY